jgi:hypothetical protein
LWCGIDAVAKAALEDDIAALSSGAGCRSRASAKIGIIAGRDNTRAACAALAGLALLAALEADILIAKTETIEAIFAEVILGAAFARIAGSCGVADAGLAVGGAVVGGVIGVFASGASETGDRGRGGSASADALAEKLADNGLVTSKTIATLAIGGAKAAKADLAGIVALASIGAGTAAAAAGLGHTEGRAALKLEALCAV